MTADPVGLKTFDSVTVSDSERLAVVFVAFQTGNRANGGIASITKIITRMQHVQPLVVTQRETPVNERWREAGIEVQVWSELSKLSGSRDRSIWSKILRLVTMIRSNWRMYRLIRNRDVRVVHCNDTKGLVNAALGARLRSAAVLLNLRGTNFAEHADGWRGRIAANLATQALVLSREMKERYSPWLGKSNYRKEIEYIYSIIDFDAMNGATQEERKRLRKQRNIPSSRLALGYIGSFWETKGQLRFIKEAGPLLREYIPEAHVYFLGDFNPEQNSYACRCLEAVEHAGLSDVFSFIGYTSDVANWYRALDVVVVASRHEGMARAMIESLACGTPVVSFDVCSAREILEEHGCGLVVPQGDVGALVYALETLATDAGLRRKLGRNGWHTTRKLFAPEQIVKQYEQLYRQMAGEATRV